MAVNDLDEPSREAFNLSRDAHAAGLIVLVMAPHWCDHSKDGGPEFQVFLCRPDGSVLVDARHQSAAMVRQHISTWGFSSDRPG